MHDRSFLTVDHIDNSLIANIKDDEIKLDKLRAEQYQIAAARYSEVLTPSDEITREELIDEETEDKLYGIPERDAKRIVTFVRNALTYISEEDLTDLRPINQRHLAGLFAAIYLKQKELGKLVDEELYIRFLYAVDGESHFFGDTISAPQTSIRATQRYVQTDENNNYYDGWSNRGAVGNTAINVLISTMPIYQKAYGAKERSPKLLEQDKKYQLFKENIDSELQDYRRVMNELCAAYYPERSVRKGLFDLPVFVGNINGNPPFTNNRNINELYAYLKLNAAGITDGYDKVTGLPLTLTRLTWGWEDAERPDIQKGLLRRNVVYATAKYAIHEFVHEQHEPNLPTEFHTYINELLTDSLAEIVQLRAHGLSFTNPDHAEHRFATGYVRLVNFARDLIAEGVIEERSLVRYAFDQNPEGFINHLASQGNTVEGASKLVLLMQRNDFIAPLKYSDAASAVERCQHNPRFFLEIEMMKSIERFGVSMPLYRTNILASVSESHPNLIEDSVRSYAHMYGKDPNDINREAYFLLRDPKTGFYYDEVVDAFNREYSAGSGAFITKSDVINLLIGEDLEYIRIFNNLGLHPDLELNNLNSEQIVAVLIATEKMILRFVDSKAKPSSKDTNGLINFSARVTEMLYLGLLNIITERYSDLSLKEQQSQALSIIQSYIERIDPLKGWSYDSVEDAVSEILARINILTDGEAEDLLTIPQVVHYGPAVEIPKKDLEAEMAKAKRAVLRREVE